MHPSQSQRTIAACFADEQPVLRPGTAQFEGYVEHMMRLSSTCLVTVDRNRYSVPAGDAGQAVSVRTTADQVRVVSRGEVICRTSPFVCRVTHVLDALTTTGELTLKFVSVSAPIVMNELRRLIAPHLPALARNVPDRIALTVEPLANCNRYDYFCE